MKRLFLTLILIVFLTATACSLPVETRWSATPTALPASVTPTQSLTTTPGGPTPTAESLGDVPTLETSNTKHRAMPDGVVNIMVLGSDYRANSGYRTDVMMFVSVNTVKQTVSVISFPRDLYVDIPGWTTQRLNTAMPHGGFKMLADTLDTNFGIRPDYYVLTDFEGFKSIINGMGGVKVYVGSRLTDSCDLPIAQGGKCSMEPGPVEMDGDTALWYVRSRHTTNDLDRNRRQQEVISAIFNRVMTGGVSATNLPGLLNRYKSAVQTDLTVQAITPLLPTSVTVFSDRSRIKRYTLTVNKEVKSYVTNTGAMVLLPDYAAISNVIDEAIFQ